MSTYKKKKKKKIWMLSSVVILFFALLFFCIQLQHIRNVNNDDYIDYDQITAKKPFIEKEYLTKNPNSRPGIKLKNVNGIVIHYTANPGSGAYANRDYFESRKDEPNKLKFKVSSHFIVGLDGTVVQCIPMSEIAYASNNRNKDTISIECCHPDSSGKFNKATYRSVVKLSSWLCKKYKIKKKNIIRHYDVTGKLCPLYYVKHPKEWQKLRNSIWKELTKRKKKEK